MTTALRPMSTGEVLDRTFHLYRNNFQLFAGITMVLSLVQLIGSLVVVILVEGLVSSNPDYRNPAALGTLFLVWAFGFLFLFLIGYALSFGATMYAVSQVHLGNRTTIRESYRSIRPQMWSIINIVISILMRINGAFLVVYIGIVLLALAVAATQVPSGNPNPVFAIVLVLGGLATFFVWGLSIFCKYALAVPACLLEKINARSFLKLAWWVLLGAALGALPYLISKDASLGWVILIGAVLGLSVTLTLMPKPALRRSKQLAKGSLFRIFIVVLLFFVLYVAFVLALQYAGKLIFSVGSYWLMGWSLLAGFVVVTLAFPVVNIACSLFYYDQRIRKEAFDLQLMMEAVGQAPAPPEQSIAAAPSIG